MDIENIKVLGDRVLIKKLEQKKGVIIIPDSVNLNNVYKAKVIQIGTKITDLKKGDIVDVQIKQGDKIQDNYIIVNKKAIRAVHENN